MSDTIKHFPRVTPQPWKLEVKKPLDLDEEYNPDQDVTTEFHVTEPDDYMDELEFEDAITEVKEVRQP